MTFLNNFQLSINAYLNKIPECESYFHIILKERNREKGIIYARRRYTNFISSYVISPHDLNSIITRMHRVRLRPLLSESN